MKKSDNRSLFPVRDNGDLHYDPAEIRETIADRLRRVSEMVGSVSVFAEEIGVNRTQLSRYLTGQSVPRPELLLRISTTYDLPLNWLLKPHDHPETSLSEHEFGEQLYRLYRNRRFQLTDNIMPEGIYLFWKGLFQRAGLYESYLCSIKMSNGVGRIRTNMVRYLKRDGILDDSDLIDHVCGGLVVKSHSGVSMSFSDSEANIMASSYMRPANALRHAGSGMMSGFMTMHYTPGRRQLSIVPAVIERIQPDCGSVLAAGRQTGVYEKPNLPEQIRLQLRDLEIPEYGVR